MSTRFDEDVRLGEPWTFVIECHDDEDQLFTPTSATFSFGDKSGPLISRATPGANISIPADSNIVVVTIPVPDQTGLIEGIYYGKCFVAVPGGATSLQADGTILVRSVRP